MEGRNYSPQRKVLRSRDNSEKKTFNSKASPIKNSERSPNKNSPYKNGQKKSIDKRGPISPLPPRQD